MNDTAGENNSPILSKSQRVEIFIKREEEDSKVADINSRQDATAAMPSVVSIKVEEDNADLKIQLARLGDEKGS